MDKKSTNELQDLILEKKQSGAGILITSHMIHQSINISNKVVIMNKGNISKIFSNVSSKNHKEIINYYEKITSQI